MSNIEGKNIRYCIFEDEYYTRQQLISTIKALRPTYCLIGEADDCQSMEQCLELQPDLIIANTSISDCLTLTVLKERQCTIPIIFYTGFYQYKTQLGQLQTIAYLLKPASPQQLGNAISDFERNTDI